VDGAADGGRDVPGEGNGPRIGQALPGAAGLGEATGLEPLQLVAERCARGELILESSRGDGGDDRPLRGLKHYVETVSKATGVPVPKNYPVVGPDAFETGTGVHAAAVIKALKRGDPWLANRVYSGVPVDEFGFEQRIAVGPMSGKSNVVWWLEHHGYVADEHTIGRLLDLGVIVPRLTELYGWSADELQIPEVTDLVRQSTPAYAWDPLDSRPWTPPPTRLVRAVRRALPPRRPARP